MRELNRYAKQIRDSRFEILRIMAMVMIICYHFVVHGCESYIDVASMSNRILLDCMSMYGKVGVNLFVLVTGYFGVTSVFQREKLVKFIAQVFFFSVVLFGAYISLGGGGSLQVVCVSHFFLSLLISIGSLPRMQYCSYSGITSIEC